MTGIDYEVGCTECVRSMA